MVAVISDLASQFWIYPCGIMVWSGQTLPMWHGKVWQCLLERFDEIIGWKANISSTTTHNNKNELLKCDALSMKIHYKLPLTTCVGQRNSHCMKSAVYFHNDTHQVLRYCHYLHYSHYCPLPDSFCHLCQWNNRPWLCFWEAWLLLIGLMTDKWLCEKWYGLPQVTKNKNE